MLQTTSRGASPRPPIEYKLVSTYIGYYCTSMTLHNILGGFNINLQAFQAILSLCTQTLLIVGYSTLELVLYGVFYPSTLGVRYTLVVRCAMGCSFCFQEVLVTPKGTGDQGRLTLRRTQKSFGGLGVAHFGNKKPPQKVATRSYTNDQVLCNQVCLCHLCPWTLRCPCTPHLMVLLVLLGPHQWSLTLTVWLLPCHFHISVLDYRFCWSVCLCTSLPKAQQEPMGP